MFDRVAELPTALQGVLAVALLVGVAKITTVALSVLDILALLVLPGANYAKYGASKGGWAVVTGSSDGIGAEFSKQLARKGLNIVLVLRTLLKLEAISAEIAQYGVQTRVIAADVTNIDETIEKVVENTADLDVTVLVNNVGQSHSIPVPFAETSEAELDNIININDIFTLKLTQKLLPKLAASAANLKSRSLILTMGSFGGLLPTPYLAVYSGSKAFLQNWSASLAAEVKSSGIDVEFVLSYLVTSSMSKIKRTSWLIPNPAGFVQLTLKGVGARVGAQERFATITPYWSHALMHFGIAQTVGVYSKVANTLNHRMHADIRRRALRRAERLKQQ